MASLLFKEMKGLNFSCTSPASTAAICATIEGRSAISSGMVDVGGGGRAIDRYNPHLRDPRRSKAAVVKPVHLPQAPSKTNKYNSSNKKSKKSKKSSQKQDTNFLSMSSPGSSSRFLLNRDITFSDHVFAEPDHVIVSSVVSPPPPPAPPSSLLQLEMISKSHQSPERMEPSPSSSSSSSSSSTSTAAAAAAADTTAAAADTTASIKPQNQVVVLRVSLHCKGCEGKVRKHISKMKGVKSFSIDFAAKKVTVVGDVTPLGVLNSISKVKSAQFWPSPGDSQNLV